MYKLGKNVKKHGIFCSFFGSRWLSKFRNVFARARQRQNLRREEKNLWREILKTSREIFFSAARDLGVRHPA